ncbi:MAG: flippase [Candidatus Anstonellales archaeon]
MSEKSFFKGTALTIISGLINLGVGLATSIILARVLGPEGKGIFTLAILLPSLIVTFGNFGIGPATAFFVAREDFQRQKILGNNVFLSILFGILGITFGIIIIVIAKQQLFPGVASIYLYYVLILIPIELFIPYTKYVLLGVQSIKKYNYVDILQSIIFLFLLIILLLIFNTGVAGALVCYTLTLITIGGISFVWSRSLAGGVEFVIDKTYVKKAAAFGLQIHLANILGFLNYRIDVLFISALLGPSAVGLYSVGVGMVEKLWLISYAASTVLFPRVCAEKDEERKNAFTPLVARTVLWTTALGAIALFPLGRFIIKLLYSDAYLPAVGALQALLVGTVTLSAGRVLTNDIAGRGRPSLNIYVGLSAVFTNVVLNGMWIPRFGISGAAWASTVSYSVWFLGALIFYCRLSGNKWYKLVLPQKGDMAVYINSMDGILRPVNALWQRRKPK